MSKSQQEKISEVITSYQRILDNLLGTYLDSIAGYSLNIQRLTSSQARLDLKAKHRGTLSYTYGIGPPEENFPIHVTDQSEMITRNSPHGRNARLIGNMLVVLVYEYWEYYREIIASLMKIPTNDLRYDIFGDLRHLRHSIIHNRGIVTNNLANKSKELTWFKRGEQIHLGRNQILLIINRVNEILDYLIQNNNC